MGKKKATKIDTAKAAERVKKIWPILNKTYPEAHIALKFNNPLELLIATILSAQCTDTRVNIVTKDLFKKYRGARQWADAELKQIEADIKSTGFYHNKAINIKGACKMIIEKFGGKVPGTMQELLELPGVGRKTANVILGNAFGVPGVVCDTHVIRLSRRLQLSENRDPTKLEFDLMQIVPKKNWLLFSDLLIWHGRNICKARRPQCEACPTDRHCPAANRPDLW
jgi:endonuclease-3